MTTRWKLTIEYKGSDYSGWQTQDNVPTIQDEIEKAIFEFSGQKARVHGAGRTDAGVHAWGQIAHVDLEDFTKPMEGYEVAKAINAFLRPQPISVLKAEITDENFHARFTAKNKLYRYRILQRRSALGIDSGMAWHVKYPLDEKAMLEGGQYLVGHHDFTTFRDTGCQAKSPERTLNKVDVTARDYDGHGGREILIEVEGQSFLHHQVRNIAGTLKLVGEGKWSPKGVKTALDAKDRTKGGPTAPAEGLYLVKIDYK